jgi:serine phosphatase RsbU (regulator of sigma subunit)
MDELEIREHSGLGDGLILAAVMVVLTGLAAFLVGESYLLFHTFLELFTAAIGLMIFSIAWHTRKITASDYVAFLGMAAFPVALITILHTLSYKGMPIFNNFDANLPTTLWVIARAVQASAFLIAPVYLTRRLKSAGRVLTVYTAITFGLMALTFARLTPATYIEGVGLTPFKIWAEYAVIAATVGGAWLLIARREHLQPRVLGFLLGSMGATVVAELAFTLYVDVAGVFNRLGHVAHMVAFLLLYLALVSTSLEQPLTGLFLQLRKQQDELTHAYETEHGIAETLQDAMTMNVREVPGIELSHRYMPAPGIGHIGGDFYDVFPIGGDVVGFAIGDVCGKGLQAATATVRSRSAIRALAYQRLNPAELLESVNTYLYSELDDSSFVTAVFGTIDTATGEVKVAIAGHPDPVICGRVDERPPVGIRSQPLAVLPRLEAGIWTFTLAPGETLLLVTDGMIEAPGQHKRFGTDGLEEVLACVKCSSTIDDVVSSVVDALLAHTDHLLEDDVAVVALRFMPQQA